MKQNVLSTLHWALSSQDGDFGCPFIQGLGSALMDILGEAYRTEREINWLIGQKFGQLEMAGSSGHFAMMENDGGLI